MRMNGSEVDGKASGKKLFKLIRNFLLLTYRAGRNGCGMLAAKYRGKLIDLGMTDEEIFQQLDQFGAS